MSKTGPVGPGWPMTDELRHAFDVRMRELRWKHPDLTERVNEIRRKRGESDVTRGAISHALSRASSSALIPDIETALGFDPNRRFRAPSLAEGTGGTQNTGAQVSVDVVSEFLRSPDQIELVSSYQRLDGHNRASVLERVRTLLEVQGRSDGPGKTSG